MSAGSRVGDHLAQVRAGVALLAGELHELGDVVANLALLGDADDSDAVEASPSIAGAWSADVWTGIGPPRGTIAQKPDADRRLDEYGEPPPL
jgi:hypothetical protein